MRKKQWMALLLCAGISVTSCPVPGAQESLSGQEETESLKQDTGTDAGENEDVTAQSEEFFAGDAKETDAKETDMNGTDTEEDAETADDPEDENAEQAKDLLSYIWEADACENLDLSSEVFENFLKASDAYDAMTEEERAEVEQEDVQALERVRDKIAQQISAADGVTVSGNPWYVQLHVKESTEQEKTLDALTSLYEGTSPSLLYDVEISYTDIRTGESYQPMTILSLTFPVPEGYGDLTNGRILRETSDSFLELTPQREGDLFYLDSARTLTHLLVADFPAGLSGIVLDSKSLKINKGQKHTLKVTPVPDSVTETYTVLWESSDPSIAKVNKKGVVTAVKNGKATITASVKEHPDLKASCKVTVMQGANALSKSVSQVLAETKAYMRSADTNPSVGSEWFVLGLARGGLSLKENYFSTYYNHTANYIEEKKGVLTNTSKYTEYSKRILSLTAAGKDARDVGGYDLFWYLSDLSVVKEQGLNGPIWALLALNCHPDYSIPENPDAAEQNSESAMVDFLLQSELSGGGWALIGNVADSDITGMTIQALAPYYQKAGYEAVTAAIDRALDTLSDMQTSTGGYATMGVETEESCAQIIVALCSLGIDPETDTRFIKGGHWTIENLISYHIDGSGFMHVKAGAGNNGGGEAGTLNGMATEQGYYALVAYQRMKDGKTSLYDMSDVDISEGGKGDGTGTGLAEPTPKPTPIPKLTPTPVPKEEEKDPDDGDSGTKTPGGSGKSLGSKSSSGSTGKKSSDKSADKDGDEDPKDGEKKSGGWDFAAQPYQESSDQEGISEGSFMDAQSTGTDMGAGGTLLQSGNRTALMIGIVGGLAGGLAGTGLKEGVRLLIRKRRRKKK